jgi:hypothetical protein
VKETRIIALAVALLFVVVVNVFAENTSSIKPDFTFRVPVILHYIPSELQQVDVYCLVMDATGGTLGRNNKKSDIQSHELFSETVVVEVKVQEGKNPQKAKKYECNLGFVKGEVRIIPPLSPDYEIRFDSPVRGIARGTEYRTVVKGEFPFLQIR